MYNTLSINPNVMKAQLNERIVVQKTVRDVMEKNISKWQHLPALKSQYDRYVLNLKKIENYCLVLEEDLTPLKEKRKLAKDQLIERIFPISSALTVYASDIGDRRLGNLLKGKLRDIKKLSSAELIKYSKKVHESTRKMMELGEKQGKKEAFHPVSDYGLTEPVMSKLQTAVENLEQAINEYFDATLNRKKSQVKLVKRIRENDLLLKKKMDKLIHLFRDNQKAFYNAYLKARLYVPPAEAEADKPDEKETPPAAGTKTPSSAGTKTPSSAGTKTPSSAGKGKPASPKTKSASAAPVKTAPGKPASGRSTSSKPTTGKTASPASTKGKTA